MLRRSAPTALAPAAPRRLLLDQVSKRFGGMVALRTMSLEVRPGELVALLGPSGCGKTTTLRLIAGFAFPDAGAVRIDGQDVSHLPPNRRGLGMVFQNYSLFPHMTVGENIAFGLQMAGVGKAERAAAVTRMLDLIRLPDHGERNIAQLSGGQQQRVALARAIVTNPAVLLLDEPLGALDKNLREGMQTEIRRLQQSLGITTVMVTHDQDEAMTMSDRIVVMNHGSVLQVGPPREVYERPRTRFVAEFLGTANILPGHVVGGEGDRVRIALGPVGLHDAVTVEVPAPAGRTLRAGDPLELAIRPEKLAFDAAAPTHVRVAGTVAEHMFRGAQHSYVIEAPALGGRLAACRQAGPGGMRIHGQGEGVSMSFDPQDLVVLEPDAGVDHVDARAA